MLRSTFRSLLQVSGLALFLASMIQIDAGSRAVCATEVAPARSAIEEVTASEMAAKLFDTEPLWTVETGG